MARPKKNPTDRRTEQVSVRLSPLELARLQEKADQSRQTITAFVRASAMGKSITVQQGRADDFELRQELRRIGVNLNQIAKALNARQQVLPVSLVETCEKLDTLFDRMLGHGAEGHKRRPQL